MDDKSKNLFVRTVYEDAIRELGPNSDSWTLDNVRPYIDRLKKDEDSLIIYHHEAWAYDNWYFPGKGGEYWWGGCGYRNVGEPYVIHDDLDDCDLLCTTVCHGLLTCQIRFEKNST
jgi:hypothetical protein